MPRRSPTAIMTLYDDPAAYAGDGPAGAAGGAAVRSAARVQNYHELFERVAGIERAA